MYTHILAKADRTIYKCLDERTTKVKLVVAVFFVLSLYSNKLNFTCPHKTMFGDIYTVAVDTYVSS